MELVYREVHVTLENSYILNAIWVTSILAE